MAPLVCILQNLTLPKNKRSDHVVVSRVTILDEHKTVECPYTFYCLEGVPETLNDMVSASLY